MRETLLLVVSLVVYWKGSDIVLIWFVSLINCVVEERWMNCTCFLVVVWMRKECKC